MYRLQASCTTVGDGHWLPLFRLMRVRSRVKANWISRQYDSSAATSSGERLATWAVAAATSSIPVDRNANAAPVAPPASRRNERRLTMVTPPLGLVRNITG